MTSIERLAKAFAGDLTDLLNRTITNGIRISAVSASPGRCVVGYGVSPRDLRSKAIPVRTGCGAPSAYLRVDLTMQAGREGSYLAVGQSRIGVYADEAARRALCHFDYDAAPPNAYPQAHVQIDGTSEAFTALRRGRPGMVASKLGELHLPVGGRRFRPSLEDVVEMLVVEGIAEARDGWRSVLEAHRDRWHRIQLRSAVRRWPEDAADALTALGRRVAGGADLGS